MRTWKCPTCGHSVEIRCDLLVASHGPVCRQCDCDMELVPASAADELLPVVDNLLAKAEEAGLEATDLDGLVHELASSIAADINNSGIEDQLRYLTKEMGGEAVGKELDKLTGEKSAHRQNGEDEHDEHPQG